MSTKISTCPSCKTLLLNDTIQCPSCDHVLDAERYSKLSQGPSLPTENAKTAERACADCGEMVRGGLVRCWNCGAFMRPEIAEKYRKMQSASPRVIYSDYPEDQIASDQIATQDDEHASEVASSEHDEDGFDVQADDDDFELAPTIQAGVRRSDPPTDVASTTPENDTADSSEPAALDQDGAVNEQQAGEPSNGEATADDRTAESGGESSADIDDLLQVALEEEKEVATRRSTRGRGRRAGGAGSGLLVFCPNGHRIEVQERHRGLAGRCPKCKSVFVVPEAAPKVDSQEEASPEPDVKPASLSAGKFKRWLSDVHVHPMNPAKLKLKPGSLQGQFHTADFGFAVDGLLITTLVKSGGLFGSAEKKKQEVREAMLAHLSDEKQPLSSLPVASQQWFDVEAMQVIRVVQPVLHEHESQFAGVPVFGQGRIAVRLPKFENSPDQHFASFELAGFRAFANDMAELFGIHDLGDDCGVPLVDSYVDVQCHYSEETFQVLENVEFYQADKSFELELVGWRCQACGVVVSEESRQKERLGGKSPKGIGRAKCPKCQQKFGEQPLYKLKAEMTPESAENEPAETTEEAEEPATSSTR